MPPSDEKEKDVETVVVWEGDSREILRSFPLTVRRGLGEDLYRVQLGQRPLDSKPMRSIGQGVFELRQADDNGWYRVIYFTKIRARVFVLHSFVKKSAKTPPRDLGIAIQRLKAVQALVAEEKRSEKQLEKKHEKRNQK